MMQRRGEVLYTPIPGEDGRTHFVAPCQSVITDQVDLEYHLIACRLCYPR